MLKKVIQYKDLEGNNVVDDFWFHLSIADILEMETEVEGGLKARLQKMIDSKDDTQILSIMRGIVTRAVGVKSTDGRRFMKDAEHKSAFLDSNAYSAFLVEIMTLPGAAVDFANGVVPADLDEQIAKAKSNQQQEDPTSSSTSSPTSTVTPVSESPLNAQSFGRTEERDFTDWRTYTEAELLGMDNDMFEAIGGKIRPGVDKVLLAIAFKRRNRATSGGA
jgi:hypothetical protein